VIGALSDGVLRPHGKRNKSRHITFATYNEWHYNILSASRTSDDYYERSTLVNVRRAEKCQLVTNIVQNL